MLIHIIANIAPNVLCNMPQNACSAYFQLAVRRIDPASMLALGLSRRDAPSALDQARQCKSEHAHFIHKSLLQAPQSDGRYGHD
jgi:hypothetical protein